MQYTVQQQITSKSIYFATHSCLLVIVKNMKSLHYLDAERTLVIVYGVNDDENVVNSVWESDIMMSLVMQ